MSLTELVSQFSLPCSAITAIFPLLLCSFYILVNKLEKPFNRSSADLNCKDKEFKLWICYNIKLEAYSRCLQCFELATFIFLHAAETLHREPCSTYVAEG